MPLNALGLLLVTLGWFRGVLVSSLGRSWCSWGAEVPKTLARCSQIEVKVRSGEVKVMSSCFNKARSGGAAALKHNACAVKRVDAKLLFRFVVLVESG